VTYPERIEDYPEQPYSPELNTIENVREFRRQNDLGNRIHAPYGAIVDACCIAWHKLIAPPKRIRSIAVPDYTKRLPHAPVGIRRAH
jgi:hypothetical protein